jgi:hypothetical protein
VYSQRRTINALLVDTRSDPQRAEDGFQDWRDIGLPVEPAPDTANS